MGLLCYVVARCGTLSVMVWQSLQQPQPSAGNRRATVPFHPYSTFSTVLSTLASCKSETAVVKMDIGALLDNEAGIQFEEGHSATMTVITEASAQ